MYQFLLGKISTLSADPLASALSEQAPEGARRIPWLAGRTLLARALSPAPVPEIVFGEQGKPAFVDDVSGLIVGPLFVVVELAFMLGMRQELKHSIEQRCGPVTLRTHKTAH